MKNIVICTIIVSLVCSVEPQRSSRPEIVDDILPEVKQQGQIAYLNCSVINLVSPAAVQWVKQTTQFGMPLLISTDETVKIDDFIDGIRKYDVVRTRKNSRDQFQMVIRALTEEDAGDYICQIYLPNQKYLSWPTKIGHITVLIAPTIIAANAANITVEENSNITLFCEANGIPAPNVTWKRGDGFPLPGGGFQHRGGIFNVSNISYEDRGQFICIADNNIRPRADYSVQLEVRFKPVCDAVQNIVGQAQNRKFNARLDCLVAANPRAEVIWYKENKATREQEKIQDNDKYDLNQQNDPRLKADQTWFTLLIKNVQGNDYGNYFCTGTNQYGTRVASFQLYETMECQGQNCPSFSRPEIVDDILPEFKQQGQKANLTCSVIDLFPPATVQWIKQTTPSGMSLLISTDETVKIDYFIDGRRKYDVVRTRNDSRDQFQLVIRTLTETDAGDYICQIYLPYANNVFWPTKKGHITVLKTMECQGQNCPSITAGGFPVSPLSMSTFIVAFIIFVL